MISNIEFTSEGFTKRPLVFNGFWREGACSLEVNIKGKDALLICRQESGFYGNSIDSCVKAVRQAAVACLLEQNLLRATFEFSLLEKVCKSSQARERMKSAAIEQFLLDHSVWITNCKHKDGTESFCIVNFHHGTSFAYVSPDRLKDEYPDVDIHGPGYRGDPDFHLINVTVQHFQTADGRDALSIDHDGFPRISSEMITAGDRSLAAIALAIYENSSELHAGRRNVDTVAHWVTQFKFPR